MHFARSFDFYWKYSLSDTLIWTLFSELALSFAAIPGTIFSPIPNCRRLGSSHIKSKRRLCTSQTAITIPPSSGKSVPGIALSNLTRGSLGSTEKEQTGAARSSTIEASSRNSSGSEFSPWTLTRQGSPEEEPDSYIDIGSSTYRQRHSNSPVDGQRLSEKLTTDDIEVPNPRYKPQPKSIQIITRIMTGGQSSGLTGKPLLYFTSIFVSLGVFLFGYDQGVMSGVITGPYFKAYFDNPTRAEIGTMVAILEVGAFCSSLIVGRVGDIIGRRKTILYGSIIFVIGGALQTFSLGLGTMIFGRIIAGLGVGALSTIVPVYQSEISPPHNRGKLACIEFTGNIVGYASSVWVDYACSWIESDYSWRLPLFMQCVMGFLLAVGSLAISESPRWLLDNDHDEEGIRVIANLHGGGDTSNEKARQEFREIKLNVLLTRQEGDRSYSEMWRRYKRRLVIAMSSQAFAQLNGINVISYYAPLVFEQAGWIGRDAILMTGINGLVYIASTIPPWYLMDKWGRRPILLSGAAVMTLALSSISMLMYINTPQTPTLVVISVVIYNAFFGYSWGPVPWLYPPEILPLSIRAKGASLSTATNWAFNWVVGELTPVLQEWITWRLYLVHAFFCVCSFIVVYLVYPETKGIQLEDMDVIFGDQYSVEDESAGRETLLPRSGQRSPIEEHHLEPPPVFEHQETAGGSLFSRIFRIFGEKSGGAYRRLD